MRDSRLSNQIRTISCSTGILHKADGSSKFSLGESSVLAGVFGPVSVPIKLEKIDAAQLIVTVDPLSGTGGTFEKTLAAQIRNSIAAIIDLRSFPRSSIQVNLQILAQDGLILPVALNAAVIACIDAGIPMSSMIGSISVCVKADGEVVLDPDQGEVDSSSSRHVFAYEEKTGGLVLQESWGTFSVSDNKVIREMGAAACKKILDFIRAAIERKYQKLLEA